MKKLNATSKLMLGATLFFTPLISFADSCSMVPETPSISIPKWWSNSGWHKLTVDPDLLPNISGLKVTVTQNGTTGNNFHILKNWGNTPITKIVDNDEIIDINSDESATLQFYVEHTVGSVFKAELMLCEKPLQPSCDPDNYSANSVPQTCLPTKMDVTPSPSFGKWRNKIDGGESALGISDSGESCVDLHDRYWVKGDDGKAYHTWHPAKVSGCEFRHEHGDDPANSEILEYAGGYPPFGYAMEQQHISANNPNMHRHEDHFGHKVVVANNIRIAIGNSAAKDSTIYDAGITCDWFSKIHQGSYSADALTNHLHEYFLNVKCDDTHQAQPTAFSVKLMAPWGRPDHIKSFYGGYHDISPVTQTVMSLLKNPWDNSADPILPPHISSPQGVGNDGNREIDSFSSLQWKDWNNGSIAQPELWVIGKHGDGAMKTVDAPNGNYITFAPYYTIKNPARTLGVPDNTLVRTVGLCYNKINTSFYVRKSGAGGAADFCSIVDEVLNEDPSINYWKSPNSPFNGTVRGVNFKGIGIRNEGGSSTFCTDAFGRNATNLPCSSSQIKQKAATINNYWQEQNATNCIKDTSNHCHNMPLQGTLERATMEWVASGRYWETTKGKAIPLGGSSYKAPGIGFEWIINNSKDEGVRAPN